ncbi:hypothetical protein TNCT_324211 [Trichonephila clavata]|uniref:Uncharacterized protein n=1 Tax=Trichonephila clavata TaxID=2740835 RepID=A0A8X6HZR8_TRICU|nr:hypothetical protein TNCT_324211 [Trichonephila clavata]
MRSKCVHEICVKPLTGPANRNAERSTISCNDEVSGAGQQGKSGSLLNNKSMSQQQAICRERRRDVISSFREGERDALGWGNHRMRVEGGTSRTHQIRFCKQWGLRFFMKFHE